VAAPAVEEGAILGNIARQKREPVAAAGDLELMLKAELMGRLGYLETQIGHRFDALSVRIGELEGGGGPTMHKRDS
jgi:hypothetical protein